MSHHCLHSYMERTVQEKRSYDSHDPLLSDKSHGPEGSEDEVVEVAKHNHTIWGKHRASTDWNNRYYTSRMIIGSIIVSTSALVALYCISSRALTPSYFKGQSTEVKPVVASADIDLWCGKPYKHGSPTVSVGGQFPVPTRSSQPLLHFKCWPGIQPFVEGEDSVGSVILDANIGHEIGTPIESFRPNDRLLVDIKISGSDDDESLRGLKLLSGTTLPVNSSGTTPTFELGISLKPRAEPYRLECTALNPRTLQKFSTSSSLQYLPPNPYGGSVVKTDLRTGGLLVKPLDKDIKTAQYEPFFPYGFYTGFGGYIEHDLSKLDHIKAKGYNLVHLVPPFDGVEPALDKMAELGIWFIYSMRWSFQNMTSVEQQVMAIRSRPNLLLWYTSDEPDGWNYALDAPKLAAEKIKELDGGVDRGYHPVSVVLNCEDYWFKEVYPDLWWYVESSHLVTPAQSIFQDCGCDNCIGDVGYDISTRVTQFRDRARWLGKERTLSVWTVPQAFGAEA
ncbi:hypothetical protein FRC03_004186 [Tulasnella sp. 419]|nr:hypothetical protein FRC03_004186 [Tulasnella sp. 419]